MHHTDEDIDALEQLLGPARADYHALRHRGEVPICVATPPKRIGRRIALVASVALAIGVIGLLGWRSDQAHPRTSMPQDLAGVSMPDAPSTRPQSPGTARPSLASARPNIAFSLPARPTGTNG